MAQLAVNETGSGNISASSFQTVLMSQQPALYEAVSKNPSFAQLAESLPHLSESEAQAAISRFAASLPMPESSRNYIAHSLSQAYTAAKESPSDAKQETAAPLPTASSADPSGQTVQSAPGGNRAPLASPVLAQDLQSSQSQTGTSAAAAQSQEIQSFLVGTIAAVCEKTGCRCEKRAALVSDRQLSGRLQQLPSFIARQFASSEPTLPSLKKQNSLTHRFVSTPTAFRILRIFSSPLS